MEVDLLGKTVHEVAAYLTDELNFPESDVAELTRMFAVSVGAWFIFKQT